jgi:aminopeptidase
MLTFDQKLDHLATLALRIGVNLQAGDRLLLVASLETADLARRIVRQAYDLGAHHVHVQYGDAQVELARALYAPAGSLDYYPQEVADMFHTKATRGDARLQIDASDPDLLAAADPERLLALSRAAQRANRPLSDLVQRSFLPWSIVPAAIPGWARKVFPGLAEDEALARLWDSIFAAVRADVDDPVGAWHEHMAMLDEQSRRLNDSAFVSLHFTGPGTDLLVGLAEGHVWKGGGSISGVNGLRAVHNIPTEEVFTAPHAQRVEGRVRATKPLLYAGQLIDGFSLDFADGRVVDFRAERGERLLEGMLSIDAGCRRLGEVALVPASSPISRSGLLYSSTLFDENAASHIALGRAYETTFRDGIDRPLAELQRAGFNDSLTHVDFMIGSSEIDVDGIDASGARVPVMRGGEWVTA